MKRLLFVLLFVATCAIPSTLLAQQKPSGTIYRCDGCNMGITSEYLQVEYNKDLTKVLNIWYWNTNDSRPMIVKILDQELVEGEVTGVNLTVSFPPSTATYTLGLVEDQAMLSDKNGKLMEYRIQQ